MKEEIMQYEEKLLGSSLLWGWSQTETGAVKANLLM